jgi:predicted RNA-binding Zn ribbon-like protein
MRPAPAFVGDHLAIDFLNTWAAPDGVVVECLNSGADVLAWLEAAEAVDAAVLEQYRTAPAADLDRLVGDARALRDWWMGFVHRHEGSQLPVDSLHELGTLNDALATDRRFHTVELAAAGSDHPFTLTAERRWQHPADLILPIADAIADMVVNGDFALVRTCASSRCTLHFYDRTKAHSRRWCDMAVCGNRAKAAAHRSRRRTPP